MKQKKSYTIRCLVLLKSTPHSNFFHGYSNVKKNPFRMAIKNLKLMQGLNFDVNFIIII